MLANLKCRFRFFNRPHQVFSGLGGVVRIFDGRGQIVFRRKLHVSILLNKNTS